MLLHASRGFLNFFEIFFRLLGAFGGLGGSIPLIFFHIPKLYIKTQLFQKIGFLIRGGDKKIEIFFEQISRADFSLVIEFSFKWVSIPKRAWSQLSELVWHLHIHWKMTTQWTKTRGVTFFVQILTKLQGAILGT